MPIRATLNVSLTPELEEFVQSRVASGRYQTASEVIREGLRLLEEREQTREAALEELRAQLRRGIEQADGGELLDGDTVFDEIRQRALDQKIDHALSQVAVGNVHGPEAARRKLAALREAHLSDMGR